MNDAHQRGAKPYQQVLQSLLAELSAMPQTDAVLFFGSVQRGQAQATSDLDLYVVTSGTEYWRVGRVEQGVEIELFFNPAPKMRERLEQGDAVAIHGFATGELLLDRSGIGAELVARGRQLWAAGPKPLTEWQVATWRYRLTDLVPISPTGSTPAGWSPELLLTWPIVYWRPSAAASTSIRANGRRLNRSGSIHEAPDRMAGGFVWR